MTTIRKRTRREPRFGGAAFSTPLAIRRTWFRVALDSHPERDRTARLAPEDQAVVDRLRAGYDSFEHATATSRHRALVPDRFVDLFALAGTPEEVAAQVRRVDIAFEVGSTTEVVTVEAGVAVIATETGMLSGTITAENFKDSPHVNPYPSVYAMLSTVPGILDGGTWRSEGGQARGERGPLPPVLLLVARFQRLADAQRHPVAAVALGAGQHRSRQQEAQEEHPRAHTVLTTRTGGAWTAVRQIFVKIPATASRAGSRTASRRSASRWSMLTTPSSPAPDWTASRSRR